MFTALAFGATATAFGVTAKALDATAKALVAAGANVVLLDLNESLGAQRVAELGEDNTLFVRTDVTQQLDVEAALDKGYARFGAITVCVNCAGIAPAGRMLDRAGNPASLEDFSKTININLIGTFNVCRLVVASMAEEGMNYPLHLGVTEAGDGEDARIKSAVGIGSLLMDLLCHLPSQ